jgi:hypothetical protein
LPRHFNAVDEGQRVVKNSDVWLDLKSFDHRLSAIGGFGHNLTVWMRFQQFP